METIETEVIVVGGGTAGVVAALAAFEEGASTVLVEKEPVLGGLAVDIHGYHYGVETGIVERLDERIAEQVEKLGKAEGIRAAMASVLAESSVQVITGRLAEVYKKGERVEGLRVVTPAGTTDIFAELIVDCTGDAAAAVLAGAPYMAGRDWDQVSNTYSAGARTRSGDVRVEGWVEIRDPKDLTRALLDGRDRVFAKAEEGGKKVTAFYRHLGLRAGRYICGEYVLTLEDLIKGRTFSDGVMYCCANYDPHHLDYAHASDLAQIWMLVMGLWGLPVYCQIPFQSFIPRSVKGMLVASRAFSVTPEAAMGVRMIRDIRVMGEVAGTAAALCVQHGLRPRTLSWRLLEERLKGRGIRFEPGDLSSIQTSKKGYFRPVSPDPQKGEDVDSSALDLIATSREDQAVAWWEKEEEDYLDLLGTTGEGKALYHIYLKGDVIREQLISCYDSFEGAKKRGAAFGLALLGSKVGVDELIACISRRDGDIPAGRKQLPRWAGAMVLLRLLRSTRAFGVMLEFITPDPDVRPKEDIKGLGKSYWDHPSLPLENLKINSILFALRYFHEVIDDLGSEQRELLCRRLAQLVEDCPGEDFKLFDGSRRSFVWGIELSAAGLLASCGDKRGRSLLVKYLDDERGFVRNAAEKRWKEAGL